MNKINNENLQRQLMQGNEACAKAAMIAGLGFYAGYPITPSTEIMENLARRLPAAGGKFIQMEDEISSISAVLGASLAGAKSMTATSGPGFSLMQENIGYGVLAEIPAVIVNVQRLGPSTGGPTSTAQGDILQAKSGSHGDYEIIALAPSTVEECFHLTITAFNFAERYRLPVILLLEEVIGHLRETFILPDSDKLFIMNREKPKTNSQENYLPYKANNTEPPVLADFGEGYRYHVTGLMHDQTGFPCTGRPQEIEWLKSRLQNKILAYQEEISIMKEWKTFDADCIIISHGSVTRTALAAMKQARKEGYSVGILDLKTIWPFPYTKIKEICQNKTKVIVPEHNFGQIVGEVQKYVENEKVFSIQQVDGTLLKPEKIKAYIKE